MEGFGKFFSVIFIFILSALALTTWKAHNEPDKGSKSVIHRSKNITSKK
jgi:hypothetical protein